MRRENSSAVRVFPMPGSPARRTRSPRPPMASSRHAWSSLSSRSRPTNGPPAHATTSRRCTGDSIWWPRSEATPSAFSQSSAIGPRARGPYGVRPYLTPWDRGGFDPMRQISLFGAIAALVLATAGPVLADHYPDVGGTLRRKDRNVLEGLRRLTYGQSTYITLAANTCDCLELTCDEDHFMLSCGGEIDLYTG